MTLPGTLPPGQIETKRFPIVGERKPSGGIDDWRLRLHGLVGEEVELQLEEYLSLDHREFTFDIHCVTSWSRFDSRWTGVPLSELLVPSSEARYVSFSAFSNRNHHTSLPLNVAMASTWVAHEFEGIPLPVEHGGPVRVVTIGKYFYKSLKWVKSIEVLAEDRLGWWETNSSYHNNADPATGDQRFTSGSLRPSQLKRFLVAASYDKYRGKVLLGLDLRSWQPASRDLRRLYLKNCDLGRLDLSGFDLRESNLSLSNLVGANLSHTNLSGSDLEGADFTEANLSGADLRGTALSATRFDNAIVDGARFEGAWGLVETQQAYLAGRGVTAP